MPSHYQTLGVPPSASADEIRTAYRDLARRLHPDRHRLRSPAEAALAGRRMRDVNEAWRVLGDPDRRGRYDADRRSGPTFSGQQAGDDRPRVPRTPTAVASEDLVDVAPEMGPVRAQVVAGLPWIVLLVVFGLIFVVTAYASADRDPAPPLISGEHGRMGSCLRVAPGPATVSVPCDGADAQRLVARVEPDGECPAGSEPRRLGDDGRIDCLAPV
jgi:curved DNA-binding protein CbpA